MAKTKHYPTSVSLVSDNPAIPRPRLSKLIIKNFRCIGNIPVEIDLDEIVVLVGENNVGKSSILKAYEIVMSHGSGRGELSIEDFPFSKIDPNNIPELEIQISLINNLQTIKKGQSPDHPFL